MDKSCKEVLQQSHCLFAIFIQDKKSGAGSNASKVVAQVESTRAQAAAAIVVTKDPATFESQAPDLRTPYPIILINQGIVNASTYLRIENYKMLSFRLSSRRRILPVSNPRISEPSGVQIHCLSARDAVAVRQDAQRGVSRHQAARHG